MYSASCGFGVRVLVSPVRVSTNPGGTISCAYPALGLENPTHIANKTITTDATANILSWRVVSIFFIPLIIGHRAVLSNLGSGQIAVVVGDKRSFGVSLGIEISLQNDSRCGRVALGAPVGCIARSLDTAPEFVLPVDGKS